MKNLIFLAVLTTFIFSSCKDANEPEWPIYARLGQIAEPSGNSPHAYFHIYSKYEQWLHTDIEKESKETYCEVFACNSNWNSYLSKFITINDSTIYHANDYSTAFKRQFDNEYVDKFNVNIEHKDSIFNLLVDNLPKFEFDIKPGEVIEIDRSKPLIIKYSTNGEDNSKISVLDIFFENCVDGKMIPNYAIVKENIENNGEFIIPVEDLVKAPTGKMFIYLRVFKNAFNDKIPNTLIDVGSYQAITFNVNVK